MKKIVLGITSLTLGGAERVLVDLVNKLDENFEITIFTLYGNGELEKQVSSKVKIHSIYNKQYQEFNTFEKRIKIPLKILLTKTKIYKKEIKNKYDLEIAFLEGPITRIFSSRNKKVKKIAWVHNNISLVFGKGIKSRIKKYIDRKIYSKYQTIVFVSRDNMKEFIKTYPDLRNRYLEPIKKEVIYNYIDKEQILLKSREKMGEEFDKNTTNFLTVARLVQQKGIDRLIKVHSKLIKDGFYHNFYIIGDGPEKENLTKMINENKVQNTFHILGKQENPYPYIKQADYFCLFSYFEGYGMVLEEAKILNKPILITNTAAREAIEKYPNGNLVDNTNEAIYQIMKEKIGKKPNQDIEFDYDNNKILEKIKKVWGE